MSDTITHTHGGSTHTHTHTDSELTQTHTHSHDAGITHAHEHIHNGAFEEHVHSHSHTHDPAHMKAIINRLSRSIGHLESVKKMLEDEKDCADVLIQLAAVRSEINNAGKLLLKEHMEHCIVEAVAENDTDAIANMNKAIDMFMK